MSLICLEMQVECVDSVLLAASCSLSFFFLFSRVPCVHIFLYVVMCFPVIVAAYARTFHRWFSVLEFLAKKKEKHLFFCLLHSNESFRVD